MHKNWKCQIVSVFMRDTLPLHPCNVDSGIVYLNTSNQPGSHWASYYRNGSDRDRGKEVIQRNTDSVEAVHTPVLSSLLIRIEIINERCKISIHQIICDIMDIHKVIPFNPKKGFVLPKHRFTGPYDPLDSKYNPLPGNEPFNDVDAISMRHGICYRDNDTPAGKCECDRKMLAQLNALVLKGLA